LTFKLPYTLQLATYTLNPTHPKRPNPKPLNLSLKTPKILRPKPYTLNPQPYALNPTP